MGSLLTEGDHLYLDRNADWNGALDLLMAAVSEHARAAEAGTIVLRDLHAADLELAEAIRERGYVKTSLPDSLVYEPVVGGDDEWLAQLTSKARVHQRKAVLPFDDAYEVEFLRHGGRAVSDAELDHLYELYLAVQARGRDLNSFPLPKGFLREHARAPVVGADDAAAEGDGHGRRVRRALRRRAALRADDRRARLRADALARRVPPGAAPGDRCARGRSAPSACCWAWARRSRRRASARTCRSGWRSRRPRTTTPRRCWRRWPPMCARRD